MCVTTTSLQLPLASGGAVIFLLFGVFVMALIGLSLLAWVIWIGYAIFLGGKGVVVATKMLVAPTRRAELQESPEPGLRVCLDERCGGANPAVARFCRRCGRRIASRIDDRATSRV